MPLFEKNEDEARYTEEEEVSAAVPAVAPSAMDDLLGLGDIGVSAPIPEAVNPTSNMAALNDLLGGPITPATPTSGSSALNGLVGLIDTPVQAAAPVVQTTPVIAEMAAWSNDHIDVKFAMKRENNILNINLTAVNLTLTDSITDFVFQGQYNHKT